MDPQSCWTARNMALCIIFLLLGPQTFARDCARPHLLEGAGRGLRPPVPPPEGADWSVGDGHGAGSAPRLACGSPGRCGRVWKRGPLTSAAAASCALVPDPAAGGVWCGIGRRSAAASRGQRPFSRTGGPRRREGAKLAAGRRREGGERRERGEGSPQARAPLPSPTLTRPRPRSGALLPRRAGLPCRGPGKSCLVSK